MKCRCMRKLGVCLLLLLVTLFAAGCGAEKQPEPAAGVYEVDYELKYHNYDLRFTPWLRLEPEKSKFVFMYGADPRPAGYPWGYYTIEGTTLTATAREFGLVYTFEILDEKTIRFVGANAGMGKGEYATANFTDTAKAGDIFYWTEELPE